MRAAAFGLVLTAALVACGAQPTAESGPIDAGRKADAGTVPTKFTCTSDFMWDLGDEGDPKMHPGMACITCHKVHKEEGHGGLPGNHNVPNFTVAGTLYAGRYEYNDCNGVDGTRQNAVVEITDTAGKQLSLMPNSAGNFFTEEALQFPIRARVMMNGKVREMAASQTSGDCNLCHSPGGQMGAPGRVYLPE